MKTVSNVYFIGFAITLCFAMMNSSAASSSSSSSSSSSLHSKPRTTRGFKNAALSTARGFGKRDRFYQNSEFLTDVLDEARRGYFGELFKEPQDTERFPVDWFAEEMASNPKLARLIVRKFVDQNQDGELSTEELFRNVGY